LKNLFIKSPKPDWLNVEYLFQQGVVLKTKLENQLTDNRGRRVIETLANSLQLAGLPELLRHGDRNSMRFSVESRVPFLTISTADLLLSLPEDYLISNKGETKSVFRAAMRGIVPDYVLDRKDKIGFATPEKDFLKQIFSKARLRLQEFEPLPWLNKQVMIDELDSIIGGKKPFSSQAWRFINFTHWYQLVFLPMRKT
jgi:asparagine synthase (glutamine-hydrolysing)